MLFSFVFLNFFTESLVTAVLICMFNNMLRSNYRGKLILFANFC